MATEPPDAPRLVALGDLRGDLHMHTTATDGRDDLDSMAAAAQRLGHEYIAITDHSKAMAMSNGLNETRALEHAAAPGRPRAGAGLATQRIGPGTRLRVVDAIVSGTHEPGTSHYELLRAFASDEVLARASDALEAGGYRTHEFGDSVLVEARRGLRTGTRNAIRSEVFS